MLFDGHHTNSTEAVDFGKGIWQIVSQHESVTTQPRFSMNVEHVQQNLKSVLLSRNGEPKFADHGSLHAKLNQKALLAQRIQAIKKDVQDWFQALQYRKGTDGRLYVNGKQLEAVAKVANRVCEELLDRVGTPPMYTYPLIWMVDGGGGTVKFYVVRDVIKNDLFEEMWRWQHELDYQVSALQAVMGDLLKGDIIHHNCGISVRQKRGQMGDFLTHRHKNLAEKSLYWRWLVIDEFGMDACSLLAEVNMKLHDVIVDVNPYKRNKDGHAQPFDGLNILFSGDLWELGPAYGEYLNVGNSSTTEDVSHFV